MFAEKTLFVVGAGASYEAGLPTGDTLRDAIVHFLDLKQSSGFSSFLRYAPQFPEAGARYNQNAAMMEAAAKRISKGIYGSFSIDNFIDENQDDPYIGAVGKLAIAKTILDAEGQSKMSVDATNTNNYLQLAELKGTWYTKLSSLLFEGCTIKVLHERLQRLTFIIFNYDRCVEHYLFWALRHTYGLTNQDAAQMLSHVTFHHPYGQVGPLPFLEGRNSLPVHFGNPKPFQVDIWEVSKGLKTFTEGITSIQHEGIQAEVLASNMVIFLGFAFHNLNMSLLEPSSISPNFDDGNKSYFGTVYGRSKNDIRLLENRVMNMCQVRNGIASADLADCTCSKLFDEYHATFAMDWGAEARRGSMPSGDSPRKPRPRVHLWQSLPVRPTIGEPAKNRRVNRPHRSASAGSPRRSRIRLTNRLNR